MKEHHIAGNICNELFSESSEEKCTAFQSMGWSLIVHKSTIKNCSNVPQAFFSRSLSFVSFISLFVKVRILLQFLRPAFIILYVLLIFSRFHKCYDNFHWSKNLPTSKFFHWNMCFLIFLLPWRKGGGLFSLKQNNLMRLKTKRFLFILNDNHTEIWEIIFSAIKIWAFAPARLEIILCKSEWE